MKTDQNKIYDIFLKDTNVDRLQKILSKYELFKKVINVPGDICECGVFKGAGFMYWLKLLDLYARGEQRKVIGFDTFNEFSNSLLDYEKQSAKDFTDESQFEGVDPEEILNNAKSAGFKNCELVAGDVLETIPNYVKQNIVVL